MKTFVVKGATHFTVLAPLTALLAKKILSDTIVLSDAELAAAMRE